MNKVVNGKIIPLTEEEIAQREADAIKAQEEQQLQSIKDDIDTHRKYLSDTDWYVIRKQENGTEIPHEVLTARDEARANIDNLRQQLGE